MHLHYWCDTVASKEHTDFSMIMFIKNKGRVVTLTNTEDETVDELPLEGISDHLHGNLPLPFFKMKKLIALCIV